MLKNIIEKSLTNINITNIVTVPCTIIADYLPHENSRFRFIYPSNEEEGIGILGGLNLTNQQGVMFIQNSGFGKSINAICSLLISYEITGLIFLSMRGLGTSETNEVQRPLGEATKNIITNIGCEFIEVKQISKLESTINQAYQKGNSIKKPIFILLPRKSELYE